eukprot:TRINITY_DN77538_c0_g1_i1.p1 TRINITY_DN77538_c0_g1~~TRINITY_DN77538_c0_g1_i1.p1  ORF type:complete len:364 (-),score=84.51 TRINITY_DN77538_c0_g1_i1:38-1129(-)
MQPLRVRAAAFALPTERTVLRLPQRRALFVPSDVARTLEAAAETGRHAVNIALAATGSSVKFQAVGGFEANSSSSSSSAREQQQRSSLFWNPDREDSPFFNGREAFIAKHLSADTGDCSSLVPDKDVESYVDNLIATAVLSNVSLPPGVGRQLYCRVVRIVQRTIINVLSLVEGEFLGKELRLLKQPSGTARLKVSGKEAPIDERVIRLLARRTIEDHQNDHPYLMELGLPQKLVERLYEDIIALSVRLVFDTVLSFQIRCLGHTLNCQISADELLHEAPGWNVALDEGAFGLFDDAEKRRWAKLFVTDLLKDSSIRMQELPESVQERVYSRVVLVLLNLVETALNHFRIHVGGMSFRPALLD